MKKLIFLLSLITTTPILSQSINVIAGFTQYAHARGSIQVDSMFVLPYRDTIYTFSNYPAMRVPARMVIRPQDKKIYIYNGVKWISPFDRSNHSGTQNISTITGLSTVATTNNYWDLSGLPDMSQYITYSDTIPGAIMTTSAALEAINILDDKINEKVNISDTNNMLSHYIKLSYLNTVLNTKLNISDTTIMLSSYLRSSLIPAYTRTLSSFNVIKASTDLLYESIFSKNTAFNKNYGSTSGTTAEGNDSRILNGQTAFGWGNHSSAGYFLLSNFNSTFDTRLANKTTDNLIEGTVNKYFSNTLSRNSITLTTTGTSGAATYNSSTGVFNIPNYNVSGEANTASNIGSGLGLFKQKTGLDLQFKTILGTTDQIIVTSNTNDITLSLPTRTETSVTRSLVTTTASTGFQPSSISDIQVTYSIYAQVTSALIGTNTADVYLEVAPTNSTTPSDWITKSRSGISMAGLVSTTGNTQTVSCFVRKGYYTRIRIVSTGANSGAAVFTYQVGQENTY